MLEAIGGIGIVVIIIYFIVKYYENSSAQSGYNQKMISNSSACQDLIAKYNLGKTNMSYIQFNKELIKIINDPNEKKNILEAIDNKTKIKNEIKKERRIKRKIGFKYDVELFAIFNDKREIASKEFYPKLIEKFRLKTGEEFKELLQILTQNGLIERCRWNDKKYVIGDVLKSDLYKIDEEDIVYDEWLKVNNIILEEHSEEYKTYMSNY